MISYAVAVGAAAARAGIPHAIEDAFRGDRLAAPGEAAPGEAAPSEAAAGDVASGEAAAGDEAPRAAGTTT